MRFIDNAVGGILFGPSCTLVYIYVLSAMANFCLVPHVVTSLTGSSVIVDGCHTKCLLCSMNSPLPWPHLITDDGLE